MLWYLSDIYSEEFEQFEEKAREIKGIEPLQAHVLTLLVMGEISPDGFPSVMKWCKQCYNEPSDVEKRMCAADEIIGGHGVEYITNELGCSEGECNNSGTYVNLGDTYDTTLFYDYGESEFMVCSWGDWIEEQERCSSKTS